MEISFRNRECMVYRAFSRQTGRTQENTECVVPDTEADIEKIAAVQSALFLKSKDLTGRGVLISGEAAASVLYIREGQEGLSCLRVRQPFSMEFEVENLESDAMAQVSLLLQGADVRLVNPRKISVTFEIEGTLECFCREKVLTESGLPEENPYGLHAKTETQILTLPNALGEKSVAVNEQFGIPAGTPKLSRLVSEQAQLLIGDCQLIGSRCIVKGSVEILVCAMAEESGEPVTKEFSVPFSQILDIGAESMAFCIVRPEITGAYFDLIDTVNGEKALDLELHAVLQLLSFGEYSVSRITDVYSNLMPTELIMESAGYERLSPPQKRTIGTSEHIGLTERCGRLLGVFGSPSRIAAEQGKLSAAVNLDFLYENADGKLSAGRRMITISEETDTEGMQLLGVRTAELNARAEGETVDCSVSLEITCLSGTREDSSVVTGVALKEDSPYATDSFPSVTLVRPEGESLWELARLYHSSEELIRAVNADAKSGQMLMIPKCLQAYCGADGAFSKE